MAKDNYDLIIIGGGSASFAGAIRAVELGKRVAMIERGTLGGTCVNVGCVPSKTLIRAAETRHRARHSNFAGITPQGVDLDFATLMAEKDRLVGQLRGAKYEDILRSHVGIDLITGSAAFISEHEIKVGERLITGDYLLIATGASPYIPPLPGLDKINYLTSTTAFQLSRLPESMVLIGGRYIALELAQLFARLGTKVTIIQRSERILPTEDPDITTALSKYLADEGIAIITGVTMTNFSQDRQISITFTKDGSSRLIEAAEVVVATGRRPNTEGLNLPAIGLELNQNGAIITNEYNQTSLAHIYAAGDVIATPAFVYTAAREGKLAVDHAFGGKSGPRDYSVLPYVIFTDPQVAGVGLNELTARAEGVEVEIAKLTLDNVPRALAARDTRGFIKLLKKKDADYLVGASILAPEGGELLMELAMAIRYKIPVKEIAAAFHPYLTLGEGVKLAAQSFAGDIKKLSCCAA